MCWLWWQQVESCGALIVLSAPAAATLLLLLLQLLGAAPRGCWLLTDRAFTLAAVADDVGRRTCERLTESELLLMYTRVQLPGLVDVVVHGPHHDGLPVAQALATISRCGAHPVTTTPAPSRAPR